MFLKEMKSLPNLPWNLETWLHSTKPGHGYMLAMFLCSFGRSQQLTRFILT